MAGIHLTIVTPDAMVYEGDVDSVVVRTVDGEVCILPRHIDYLAALGSGEARINAGGHTRRAQCSGGVIHVTGGRTVRILSNQFSWKEA